MRAMVRRAFPQVSVTPGIGHTATRFDWDGQQAAA